jgi:hypothetical protein
MAQTHYLLVTHVFKGGRFDDHGVDIDVLPELTAYKELIVETAKEIWRRKHPRRVRLPRNFEESLSLKFYTVEPRGSAAIPLMRVVEESQSHLPLPPNPDELDEAVDLITDTIRAVANDELLPEELPKNVMPLFETYGKTMRPDEVIELKPARGARSAEYSARERCKLVELAQAEYEDAVELVGEIRAADLDGASFSLRCEDETKVQGKFSPEQEATITDALRQHSTCRLRVKGIAKFQPGGRIKRVLNVDLLAIEPAGEGQYDESAASVWDMIEDISRSVTDEEWAKVPTDLSKNLDHYLYGARPEDD